MHHPYAYMFSYIILRKKHVRFRVSICADLFSRGLVKLCEVLFQLLFLNFFFVDLFFVLKKKWT